jgi:hypothetical protein
MDKRHPANARPPCVVFPRTDARWATCSHRHAFSGIVKNLATCQTTVLILRTARISGHIWSPVCTRVRSLFSAARSLNLVCRISTARPAFGKSHFDPDRFQKPNVTRPSRFSSQKIINSIKYSCSSEHHKHTRRKCRLPPAVRTISIKYSCSSEQIPNLVCSLLVERGKVARSKARRPSGHNSGAIAAKKCGVLARTALPRANTRNYDREN